MGALPEASAPCHVPVKTLKPAVDDGAYLLIGGDKLLKNVQQRPEMGWPLTVSKRGFSRAGSVSPAVYDVPLIGVG
jgi:hypothetical protein